MAQGRAGLQKLQMGFETTPGTSVACTSVWRGPGGMLEDQRVVSYVEELVGILGGTNRSYIAELMAGLKLASTEATFEQFPYILAMGWGGPKSGTQDGTGSDYIYATSVPTTTTNSMTGKTMTWRTGDDHEVELAEYMFCTEFTLKAAIKEALKLEAMLLGRQVATSSFTGSLSLPSVDEALAGLGKLYLDPIGTAYGTTQVASQIIGMELKVKTGLQPQFTMDGQLYFTKILAADPEITGKVTFLHDSAVDGASGEKANWRSETPRSLRMKFEHASAVATPGTTYSKKSIIIDLPIKWNTFSALDRKDKATICTGEFTSKYDTTKGDAGSFTVVNELTALP